MAEMAGSSPPTAPIASANSSPAKSVSAPITSSSTTNFPPPPCPPLTMLVAVQPLARIAERAAQQSADQRDHQRFEKERNQNLPAREADDPQHADVLGSAR